MTSDQGPAQTVLLTRPEGCGRAFAETLAKRGIKVRHFPMIEIMPPEDWTAADDAIENISVYSGIAVTSANGARFFMERYYERGGLIENLPPVHAVGKRTAEALSSYGIAAKTSPDEASAAALAASLGDISNSFFLNPASDIAGKDFVDAVAAAGGKAHQVIVYRTRQPSARDVRDLDRRLIEGEIDCIAFFSPSAVKNFSALIPDFMQVTVLVAVIGRTTAVAAMGSGIRVDIIAAEQTEESLAEAIAERLASHGRVDIDPDMHMGPG